MIEVIKEINHLIKKTIIKTFIVKEINTQVLKKYNNIWKKILSLKIIVLLHHGGAELFI